MRTTNRGGEDGADVGAPDGRGPETEREKSSGGLGPTSRHVVLRWAAELRGPS